MLSSVLVKLTFFYDDHYDGDHISRVVGATGENAEEGLRVLLGVDPPASSGGKYLRNSMEAYFRYMLANSASKIYIASGSLAKRPRSLVSLFSPTIRKKIIFADPKDQVWNSVTHYLEPVINDVKQNISDQGEYSMNELINDLYFLALAHKCRAETFVNPTLAVRHAERLVESVALGPEALARVAVITGIFQLYACPLDVAILKIAPEANAFSVSERIEEIMEDAYLLEASYLRRMIGLEENVAAFRRDLRKLISFITRHRPWARGLVGAASQPVWGVGQTMKVAEKLFDIGMPEQSNYGPILSAAPPDPSLSFTLKRTVVEKKRLPNDMGVIRSDRDGRIVRL